jgi:hypothetical protein
LMSDDCGGHQACWAAEDRAIAVIEGGLVQLGR